MPSYSIKQESERPTWPNKLEYHLSICGYIFGLVTFWRFPYLAYENGGAPFLYIFLFLFTLIGIPLLFLEMTWGQYGNFSPLQAFKAVPAMQGVGICMLFLSFSCVIYFGSASYYFLLYVLSSFSYTQPWTTCNNVWNSKFCQIGNLPEITDDNSCTQNQSLVVNANEALNCSTSSNAVANITYRSTPAIEFWTLNLATKDDICLQYPGVGSVLIGLDSSNVVLAPLITLSCFAGFKLILSIISLGKHVRFIGKIASILSPLSLVVICILLVRTLSLAGSTDGILALFVPRNLESFLKPKVWKDACGQVFLSIMAASGGLITWSSYNRFYSKYQYDAALLISLVPVMSILSAVTVFSIAGYLTYGTSIDVSSAFNDATGPITPLIAYSEALSRIWGGPFVWSMVIFACLFISTATAAFPFMECILSSFADTISAFRNLILRNLTSITFLLLTMVTYIGVPCFMKGVGMQIISFFDTFTFPLSMMIIAVVEMMMILYSFGPKLLYTNAKAMTSCSCMKSHFWTFVWGILSPLVILACMVYTVFGIIRDGPDSMAPTSHLDTNSMWIYIAGGIYVGFIFLVLVLVAFTKVALSRGPCKEKFHNAFSPHGSRLTGNNVSHSTPTNGNLFLSEYSSHHPRMEMLIDEDVVTTV